MPGIPLRRSDINTLYCATSILPSRSSSLICTYLIASFKQKHKNLKKLVYIGCNAGFSCLAASSIILSASINFLLYTLSAFSPYFFISPLQTVSKLDELDLTPLFSSNSFIFIKDSLLSLYLFYESVNLFLTLS